MAADLASRRPATLNATPFGARVCERARVTSSRDPNYRVSPRQCLPRDGCPSAGEECRDRDAYLDLEGVAGEGEVLVEEVRGRLATVFVKSSQPPLSLVPPRAHAPSGLGRSRDALSPPKTRAHTHTRARAEEGNSQVLPRRGNGVNSSHF